MDFGVFQEVLNKLDKMEQVQVYIKDGVENLQRDFSLMQEDIAVINMRLSGLEEDFSMMQTDFAIMNTQLQNLEGKVGSLEARVDSGFKEVNHRLGRLENSVGSHEQKFQKLRVM